MNNLKTQFLGFINTPSLFNEFYSLKQIILDRKEIDSFDFSLLDITEKLPLGKRIERFFEFFIKQSKNYDLIKSNVQVICDKQTLGELDFLLYDIFAEKYIHVEHIYKFYLYDESFTNELDRFIGPNRDDSFAKKLIKLKDKQLPLLYKEQTQKYLTEIDINNIEQKVCFKGNIFVPYNLLGQNIPIINNSCIKGFYINHNEFLNQKYFKEFEYFLPVRNDWISDCIINIIWKSFDEIIVDIAFILNHKKSTLVWLKNKKENIIQSFFITWW